MTIIVAAVVLGGASRADSPTDLVLRPLLVALTIAALAFADPTELGPMLRPIILCAGALALLIVLQIVPLPPTIWPLLPGHALFTEAARAMGTAQPWRPLSLAPDLTFSSLLALLPVASLSITLARSTARETWRLLDLLVVLLGAGIVLGVIQASTGALYIHQFTYPGSAVGFFSNRNHEAACLAMGFPMLRVWADQPRANGDPRIRLGIACALALLIIPTIFLTGSRAGVVLGLIGLLSACVVAPLPLRRLRRRRRRIVIILGGVALIGTVSVALWSQRAVSIERFAAAGDMHGELRIRTLPTTVRMIADYFPTGSGFGTFDPAFRIAEPDSLLKPTYFNHAHNELIELAIVGGLPALAIFAVLGCTLAIGAFKGWRVADRQARAFARLGSAMLLIALTASVVDYPLRTAHMMVVATLAAAWVMIAARPPQPRQAPPRLPN